MDAQLSDVSKWRNDLVNRVSKSTCNSYYRHMKALFNTAIKDLLQENCFAQISALKVGKVKFKTIEDEDLIILKNYIESEYTSSSWFFIAMIDFLYFTDMRRRQLIGIKWNDFDVERKTLYLDSLYSKNRNENVIPINDNLIEHYKILKKKFYIEDNEQVFNITKVEKRYKCTEMSVYHVSRLFYNWSKKLDIMISPHRFRHTFGTKVARGGGNIKSLQMMMGHSDVKTTMGYIETDLEDLKKIQDLIE